MRPSLRRWNRTGDPLSPRGQLRKTARARQRCRAFFMPKRRVCVCFAPVSPRGQRLRTNRTDTECDAPSASARRAAGIASDGQARTRRLQFHRLVPAGTNARLLLIGRSFGVGRRGVPVGTSSENGRISCPGAARADGKSGQNHQCPRGDNRLKRAGRAGRIPVCPRGDRTADLAAAGAVCRTEYAIDTCRVGNLPTAQRLQPCVSPRGQADKTEQGRGENFACPCGDKERLPVAICGISASHCAWPAIWQPGDLPAKERPQANVSPRGQPPETGGGCSKHPPVPAGTECETLLQNGAACSKRPGAGPGLGLFSAAVPAGTAGDFAGLPAGQFRTLNSIRRFLARFCTVLFGTSGVVSPYPTATSRSAGMPICCR